MMKKQIKILTASLLAISILGTSGFVMASENLSGSKAAAQDTSYTLPEMLTYAIQDEFMAKAEYEAIIQKFDVTRPYSNIINAEDRHIEELLPLFSEYKVTVPANDAATSTVVPATLAETFAIGVEAEEKNIAMYEAFLKENLPDDVREVFENLRDGSLKHLAAFERGGGTNGTGAGTGVGVGAGQSRGNRGSRLQTTRPQTDPDDCLLNQAGVGNPNLQSGGNQVGRAGNGRGRGNGIS